MNFYVTPSSMLPIYEQIMNQIKTGIIEKKLLPNEALPSIRSLAKDLQISVITTKRAYEELEAEGLIYSVPGKGFYIAEQNTDLLKEKKLRMIENRFTELLAECRQANISKEELLSMIEVLYDEQE